MPRDHPTPAPDSPARRRAAEVKMVGYITVAHGGAQRLSEKWRHFVVHCLYSLFLYISSLCWRERHRGVSRSRGALRTSLDPALSVAYNAGAWQHALPTTSTHTPSPHGASLQNPPPRACALDSFGVGKKDFLRRTRPTALCSATSIPHTTTSVYPAGRPRLMPRGPRTPSDAGDGRGKPAWRPWAARH